MLICSRDRVTARIEPVRASEPPDKAEWIVALVHRGVLRRPDRGLRSGCAAARPSERIWLLHCSGSVERAGEVPGRLGDPAPARSAPPLDLAEARRADPALVFLPLAPVQTVLALRRRVREGLPDEGAARAGGSAAGSLRSGISDRRCGGREEDPGTTPFTRPCGRPAPARRRSGAGVRPAKGRVLHTLDERPALADRLDGFRVPQAGGPRGGPCRTAPAGPGRSTVRARPPNPWIDCAEALRGAEGLRALRTRTPAGSRHRTFRRPCSRRTRIRDVRGRPSGRILPGCSPAHSLDRCR